MKSTTLSKRHGYFGCWLQTAAESRKRYRCSQPIGGVVGRLFVCAVIATSVSAVSADDEPSLFLTKVAPVLQRRCLSCHNASQRKGGFSLATASTTMKGGESGEAITPGKPDESFLLDLITPADGKAEMPKDADPLTNDEVAAIRKWIATGAEWPAKFTMKPPATADLNWWSLKPLKQPRVPQLDATTSKWARTPIDAFIAAEHRNHKLTHSPEADRRTLIRRVYYDLIGLPPTPQEVASFVNSSDPKTYEKLVDHLLASPRYGERWARHWLDVVHYADTHGYDKDKLRENIWPYRDYVIRAFNEDKSYSRFVREQIAGDVLYPGTRDGNVAVGFIASGPWDFIGHAEVPETKIDGKVARNLDRDDMVSTTINVFNSLTVQCARCHNHKFDPVTQEHYYSLQAVFASIDRADREYDADPRIAAHRATLKQRQMQLAARQAEVDRSIHKQAGPELAKLDRRIEEISKSRKQPKVRPEFGYHSGIEAKQDVVKWVQVDLGSAMGIDKVIIVGCHDSFNNIGAGFGFPVRYRVEMSSDAEFGKDVIVISDQTADDIANPGVNPISLDVGQKSGRFIRVTATKLAPRQNDFIFALAEITVLTNDGKNIARGRKITSLDSIQAPVRWQRKNLADGYYFGKTANTDNTPEMLKTLQAARQELLEKSVAAALRVESAHVLQQQAKVAKELSTLPAPSRVYAGTVHHGSGNFRGRGGLGPRPIHLLKRGDVRNPAQEVSPGTLPIVPGTSWKFQLSKTHSEGDRRVALANWLTLPEHPLTWRSIVNRVWLHHFGRGIVDSPNDFGRMGQLPSHPQLLDWLAAEFRDGGKWIDSPQSFKSLHRLIVTSAVYRQSSDGNLRSTKIDRNNQFLWRMNLRKLDAESIRDTVLTLAGKLELRMYGPGFRDFIIEHPQHSPHFCYDKHNPDDPLTHRRSVYRFLVRSQQQPFMETLDCADPSQRVAKRNETQTSLQALALLNNGLVLRMAEHFSARLAEEQKTLLDQIDLACRLAIGRQPTEYEKQELLALATDHGMANVCRVIFNLNEFVFIE